ncbi:MAG: thiamine pyrophosphate-binding protein [Alphaproteobacteria bacterium]|nr:thiamine pyrophosphate-binding protein [Alphaproteobacteria bacterium]
MSKSVRGADIVVRTLERAGCRTVFTLSGNHIMSIFDAAFGSALDLVHVRQEAAAVHMADAWGRLTGEPGVAMVTGGPGHANAAAALMTALGQESPLVLLSGHAATWEIGRGGFQELRQAEMAAPVSKASWTATNAETLGVDVAKAFKIARSGRPGPVHLSLPSDLLDARVEDNAVVWPDRSAFAISAVELGDPAADAVLAVIASAQRPLLIAGPQLANRSGRDLLARIEAATGVPTCIMESPRGVADATLGAFRAVTRRADLIVLLGKPLDFTLKFGEPPVFDADCRWLVIDPEALLVERAVREKGGLVAFGCVADTRPAGEALIGRASGRTVSSASWLEEARGRMNDRPEAWSALASKTPRKLHPIEVCRALKPYVERDPDTILICDGGEYAQWGQSLIRSPRRLINGVGGSIGASLPFALAARKLDAKAPVFVMLGDGTFGFHMAEFETAVRCNLPLVAVVGTDARWNAEHNIQLREYGEARAHGCELTPARYDLVVAALGGHGELVESPADLPGAIERSIASGKPACINVMIESIAAPTITTRS